MSYKDNVTINSGWNELEPYGINALTGEADAYSIRILCDLSEKGKNLMELFLGGAVKFDGKANWNGYVGDDPAVASVLLPYSVFDDLRRFILFHVEKKTYVYKFNGGTMVGTDEEYDECSLANTVSTYVNYSRLNSNINKTVDGRNVHQATGRVV